MNNDWQTWTALGVVIITAALFAARAMRKKKGGCSSCGSANAPIAKR
jgi:hypothetical protein